MLGVRISDPKQPRSQKPTSSSTMVTMFGRGDGGRAAWAVPPMAVEAKSDRSSVRRRIIGGLAPCHGSQRRPCPSTYKPRPAGQDGSPPLALPTRQARTLRAEGSGGHDGAED